MMMNEAATSSSGGCSGSSGSSGSSGGGGITGSIYWFADGYHEHAPNQTNAQMTT
jgi:hypothetical protein